MTLIIIALLYLGQSLVSGNPALSGALSKPTIRMVPGNVVTSGNQVTIFCEGPLHAQEYRLYKEGSKDYWMPTSPLKTENKARFYISSIQWAHSGRYWCSYKSLINMSERKSDIMELVVTGVYRGKVALSAIPSYVVTSGEHVTLQCFSKMAYHRFILMKEDEKLSMAVPARKTYTGRFQAMFTVGPVTPNQRWRFTCYGYYLSNSQLWSLPSNHLDLLVPGTLQKPSIWAHPSSVMTWGSPVTIWCEENQETQRYVLYREGSQEFWYMQVEKDHNKKANFNIPSVSQLNAGQYRCYSYTSFGWSEPSDTLELVATGVYHDKPSLSALPSPAVTSGRTVTLRYVSSKRYDWFLVTGKDLKFSVSQKAQLIHTGQFQSLFPELSVASRKSGPFRYYGYYTSTPHVWSVASNPLQIHVSGSAENVTASQNMSNPNTAPETQDHHTVENLIRMGMAGLVILVLGILVFVPAGQHEDIR